MPIIKKYILLLGEGPTDGLDDTTIITEVKYSIILLKQEKNCESSHYNGSNSFLYANDVKVYKFRAKDSEIEPYSLSLGNISKDFRVHNMKKLR